MRKILSHGSKHRIRDDGYVLMTAVFCLFMLLSLLVTGVYLTGQELQVTRHQLEEIA